MNKEELIQLLRDPDVCHEIFLIVKNGGTSLLGETVGWFGGEGVLTRQARTRELLAACPCRDGCPSCVGATAGPGAKGTLMRILDELLNRSGEW